MTLTGIYFVIKDVILFTTIISYFILVRAFSFNVKETIFIADVN